MVVRAVPGENVQGRRGENDVGAILLSIAVAPATRPHKQAQGPAFLTLPPPLPRIKTLLNLKTCFCIISFSAAKILQ